MHVTRHIRQWTMPLLLAICMSATAQSIREEIELIPQRSAGIRYSLPTNEQLTDTPVPDGKKPFYISHYGSSAAYYLDNTKDYTGPLSTMAKADSLDKLTPLGQDVLHRLELIYKDAKLKVGELTEKGAQQMRQLAQQMVDRFPEVFFKGSIVDGRSIVRNHNILSMQEAMIQISRACTPMDLRIKSSHSNDAWMYVRDKDLEADRYNEETEASYQAFRMANKDDDRLMNLLFTDADYVKKHVDSIILSDQLFVVANTIQDTPLADQVTLYDLFTPDEIYRHWRIHNARTYISYGRFALNGTYQAYSQRAPLWNLLHMGDSVKNIGHPVVHLRYTTRGMLTSLICLMELNGYGLVTADLDQLDKQGWADYRIAPFGASVQVIHYRKDMDDDDILIKVLLNGKETRLPIESDCAPYYHWQDAKRYYLRKLYAYERLKYENETKKQKK